MELMKVLIFLFLIVGILMLLGGAYFLISNPFNFEEASGEFGMIMVGIFLSAPGLSMLNKMRKKE